MMAKVKGAHPWALILCHASDQTVPDWPALDYFNRLIASPTGNGLYTWWQQVSNGNLGFVGSAVFGWYGLSQSLAEISPMGRSDLINMARAAAMGAGADLSGYLHTLAIVTGYPGSGNIGTDVAYGISATNGQPGWRWCAKCEGLAFWDGSRNPGPCIAKGHHDHSASSYYSLPHDTSFPNGQSGWHWCNKCETVIFETAMPAPCPAGGSHGLNSSAHYVLRMNDTAANEQQGWRWCNKCQALAYYDGSGPCPISDRHDHTGSGKYSIPYAWAANLGFLAHETGHGFGLDHSFGTSRSGDFYNDRRPGAYGDWTDIMSWAGTAAFAEPLFTPAGAGLSAPTLYKLGWLSDADAGTIVPPASVQSFVLQPLYSSIAGTLRMIRVVKPAQGWIYTAEYRVPMNWDQGIQTPRVVVHAMRTLYEAGQDGWRRCSNCEGLIYAGQTACPAGGVHDGSSSSDYWLSLNAGPGAGQSNWRWCKKCCGLFFAGNATPGPCPSGGNHDGSSSGDYALSSSGSGQSNWQWCNKCQGLAFADNSTAGVCPAGGLHDHSGSANYVLYLVSGANRQSKWRWCQKCQGLYFAGLGACKDHDIHNLSGDDYALVRDLAGAVGQEGWRYCRKCYGIAFSDGSRPPGVCAAGGIHDHSTSGHYVIPRDAEAEAGARDWYVCQKCSALNYVDHVIGPGVCAAGGRHDPYPDAGYIVAHDTTAVVGTSAFRWCRKCENMVLGNNPPWCKARGNHDTVITTLPEPPKYVVRTDPAPLMREQAFWRTCSKCSTLFALKSPDGSSENPCAAGGTHSATGEYFLTFAQGGYPFWRWCRKCELMAFWDGSRSPGPCPVGGTHDHTGSGCYIPPRFGIDVTQVVNDNLVAGASWSDPSNHVRFEVTAMDADTATVRVTAA
jgi:hypothetical protein